MRSSVRRQPRSRNRASATIRCRWPLRSIRDPTVTSRGTPPGRRAGPGAKTSVSTTLGTGSSLAPGATARTCPASSRLIGQTRLARSNALGPPPLSLGKRSEAAVVLCEDHRRPGERAQAQGDRTCDVLVRMDHVGSPPAAAQLGQRHEAAGEPGPGGRLGTRTRAKRTRNVRRPSSHPTSVRTGTLSVDSTRQVRTATSASRATARACSRQNTA
jgi:hypothetical protein